MAQGLQGTLQAFNWFPSIVPSDTLDLLPYAQQQTLTQGIWVGTAGNVAAVAQNGLVTVFTAVPAGSWLPLAVRRINAAGTTAGGLVALYLV